MPQFTFVSVSVMTWLSAGTISSHFELGPQLPLLPVAPVHCLSLTSLVIESDRSITSMMSGGIIFALWVLTPQFESSVPVALPPSVPVDPATTMMTGVVPPLPPPPAAPATPPVPAWLPASTVPPEPLGSTFALNPHPAVATAARIHPQRAVDPNMGPPW